ncbi:MAG: hypothetical protein EB165_06905 [Euryarchaeota archaeon]|nr:hypothetical protein [Euryarchaeota archaeon]NDB94350.1 hypothetical protein [Euryarchaeota archaeon]
MRAKEFLSERGPFGMNGKRPGKMDQRLAAATPGAYTADMDRYYGMYRASMLMARAPGDDSDIDTDAFLTTRPYMGAYTEAERKMIDAANKAMGIKTKVESEGPSRELEDTNTQSPVQGAKWQKSRKNK